MIDAQTTGGQVLASLDHHDLKQEGTLAWRCNAPWRPGANSRSLTVKLDSDGEKGTYYDHVAAAGGSLYELAAKLGITPTPRSVVATAAPLPPSGSKRRYAGLADYARQHGVAAEVFGKAGWQEVSRGNRPALQFATATGTRWRFLDGDKPAFKSPPQYQACWYGLDRAIRLAEKTGYLVLTNGEPSVVVAQHFGLPAACITGSSERGLPDALLGELREQYSGAVLLALDCDTKGRLAAHGQAQQLRGVGFAVDVLDLQLGHKEDLADFCRLHEAASGDALTHCPILPIPAELVADTPAGRLWHYVKPLSTLMATEFPPIRWAVPGIFPEGVLLLCGKPKIGKSAFILNICIAVGSGGLALGTIPVERGGVLYLALEDGDRRLKSRAAEVLMGEAVPAGIEYATTWPGGDDGAVELISAWLDERPEARLVVVDTLKKIRPRGTANQNIYDYDYEAVDSLHQLAAKRGVAIVVVHHTRKADASDFLEEASGSNGLTGAADGVLVLRRDRLTGEAVLNIAGRDVPESEQALSFEFPFWKLLGDASQVRASQEREDILGLLARHPQGLQPREIADHLDRNPNTTRKLLGKMADQHMLVGVNGRYRACARDVTPLEAPNNA